MPTESGVKNLLFPFFSVLFPVSVLPILNKKYLHVALNSEPPHFSLPYPDCHLLSRAYVFGTLDFHLPGLYLGPPLESQHQLNTTNLSTDLQLLPIK